ncbi:MAG: SpvB/TcaC N-terminal domain-containing protein [Verrucomicrobiales bacterium]
MQLSYNSGLGNSFVGIGWDLSLPVIKRQTDKGFPSYTETDTFLFQGEELVPLSDGTWRCENEWLPEIQES